MTTTDTSLTAERGAFREGLRVLLVEDDENEAGHLRRTLLDGPTPVVFRWQPSLEDGLRHLAGGDTSVILLDLSLPGCAGLEALDAVVAAAPEVPVVVVAGPDADEVHVEAVRRGAADVVHRTDLEPERLTRALRFAHARAERDLARRGPGAPAPGIAGLLGLGEGACARGDFTAAAWWFDCAVALRPDLAVAHFCSGLALAGLGRYEEAVDALEQAVKLSPCEVMYLQTLARFLMAVGRPQDSLRILEGVLDVMPELAPVLAEDEAFADLQDHPVFLSLVGRLPVA